MKMWLRGHIRLLATVLLMAMVLSGLTTMVVGSAQASTSCTVWYKCPVTQVFRQNAEHGVDLLTHGLPITALLSGTVTFDHWECWDGECVQDITWRLDKPWLARGQKYAYVQIANSRTHVGAHLNVGSLLGYSGLFIEFGLTPDWAYGVSGWHWGIDPRFLL